MKPGWYWTWCRVQSFVLGLRFCIVLSMVEFVPWSLVIVVVVVDVIIILGVLPRRPS